MLRTTLAQLRTAPGRLLASGLAIVLGTAFVAATLVLGASLRATTSSAIAGEYAATDVVVVGELTATDVAAVRGVPGVEVVEAERVTAVDLAGRTVVARPAPADPRLRWHDVSAGRLPDGPGEVALATTTARSAGLAIGDTTSLEPTETATGEPVRVVGLVDLSASPAHAGTSLLLADATDVDRWAAGSPVSRASVVAAAGTSDAELAAAVRQAVPDVDVEVRTGAQAADLAVASLTGDVDVVGSLLLGFAAVALVVSALVIGNTFAILVAQRTRALALMRCLGATGGQVRGSVLVEAVVLGLVASAVGALAGTGLVAGVRVVLGRSDLPVEPVLAVPATALWVPLLAGTVVTVLAAAWPARRATRIAPLAALRPADAPVVRSRTGLLRLLCASALVLGGALLLVVGATLPLLAFGLLGGVVSFAGVVLGAGLVVPRLVGLLGRLGGRAGGVPAELASLNAVRNPARTTATATALLVGTTLVTLMTVGAASTRVSVDDELSSVLPVDVTVAIEDDGGLPAELPARLEALGDVTATTALRSAVVPAGDGVLRLTGVDVATAGPVLRDAALLDEVADDTAVLGAQTAEGLGVAAGDLLTVGEPGSTTELRVVVGRAEAGTALTTPEGLRGVAPSAALTGVWLRLADDVDVQDAVGSVEDAVAGTGGVVGGSAQERAAFDQLLDTLLLVALGLLAVAVLIAVVGIGNTLSLSELERRRESALLRALGLTGRQLRGTLAVEAVLVAAVGALAGVVLGTAYGWAGTATLLGASVDDVHVALPAGQLAAVVAVAVVAALAASWLPGRRAAAVRPVVVTSE